MRTFIFSMLLLIPLSGCSQDDYQRGQRAGNPSDNLAYVLEAYRQSDAYPELVDACRDVLKAAYMADELMEERTDYPGWEGFPLKLYRYYTGKDVVTGERKEGRVWLLDPSPEQMATWIASACIRSKRQVIQADAEKLCKQILVQSAAQFPVSGIVYEDMDGKGYYPYAFKDGVTVYVADGDRWATSNPEHPDNLSCTEEQLEYCTTLTNDQLKDYTGTYARICSTTRSQYKAAGGKEQVGEDSPREKRSKAWLGVVRALYQKAWNSDENELINAWAIANL